ncbi:MAG: AIR synthase-related protein, partial [Candidatus Limnocylindrales bacterium]
FGLVGHGLEMARASRTRFTFDGSALPALDGALDLARAGVETDGAGHNRRFADHALTVEPGVPAEIVALAHDPQTSGGLLVTVEPDRVEALEAALTGAGVQSWRVGRVDSVTPGTAPGVTLTAALAVA